MNSLNPEIGLFSCYENLWKDNLKIFLKIAKSLNTFMFSLRVSGKLFSMLLRAIITMEVAMGIREQSPVIVKTFVCTSSS